MTVDKNLIEHPGHYARMGVYVEPRHLTELFTGNVSNVLKYLCRAGFKDGESKEKDLNKAKQYAKFAIETEVAYDYDIVVYMENLSTDLADKLQKGPKEGTVLVKCWRPHKYLSEQSGYVRGVISLMRSKSKLVDMLFDCSSVSANVFPCHNTTITDYGLMVMIEYIDRELEKMAMEDTSCKADHS